jgi:iron(III) transport system substrate-binding protein
MAELVKGAKQEREVVVYASQPLPEAQVIMERFQQKYPFLKVNLNRAGSEKLLTKVLTESRASKLYGDVIQTVEFSMHTFKKMGILAHYMSPEAKFFPKEFQDEGYWITAYYNPYVVGYNTKTVTAQKMPKTYEDLLHPMWKGEIMLEGTKVDWFAGMLQIMGKEKGLQYMRRLAKQDVKLRTGHNLLAQLVVAGEGAMDINVPSPVVDTLKKTGAPIDWTALGPVPGIMIGIGVTSKAPHPNAARLYMDFVLSKEGQEILHHRRERVVARAELAPELEKVIRQIKVVPVNPALAENINEYAKLLDETFSR